MSTFAFKNKGGYWATRYSFDATNYSSIDRKMITSPDLLRPTNENESYSALMLWRHDPYSDAELAKNQKCRFYGDVADSSFISFSFNDNVSSNKIYKNFSLEGSFTDTTPTASFLANDSSNKTQQRPSTISDFTEKAATLHANVGRNNLITRSNVTPIGVLKQIHQIFSTAPGYSDRFYNPSLATINEDPSSYIGTLDDNNQNYLLSPYGIESHKLSYEKQRAYNSALSPYLFMEVDFFANWQPGSSRVKYQLSDSTEEGAQIDTITTRYSDDFYKTQTLFNSYGHPKNQATFGPTSRASSKYFNIENCPSKIKVKNYRQDYDDVIGYSRVSPFSDLPVNPTKGIKDDLEGLLCVYDYSYFNPEFLAADYNQDGGVGTPDLLQFLTVYGGFNSTVDLDGDGEVGVSDLLQLLIQYGQTTLPSAGLGSDVSSGAPDVHVAIDAINAAISSATNLNHPITVYAITPGEIDGQPARGNYADMTVSFKGDFELDVVNLEYEPTTLDHSR